MNIKIKYFNTKKYMFALFPVVSFCYKQHFMQIDLAWFVFCLTFFISRDIKQKNNGYIVDLTYQKHPYLN